MTADAPRTDEAAQRPVARRRMTPVGWAILVGIFVFLGWEFVGIWALTESSFVESQFAQELGWGFALVGVGLGIWGGVAIRDRTYKYAWLEYTPARASFLAVVAALMIWIDFLGVSWAFTAIYGQVDGETFTVGSWNTGGGRSACSGPNFDEAPFAGSLCLDWSLRDGMPRGTKLAVIGRESALGIIIGHVVDAKPPADFLFRHALKQQYASSSP